MPANEAELEELIAESRSRGQKEFKTADNMTRIMGSYFRKPDEHIMAGFEVKQLSWLPETVSYV